MPQTNSVEKERELFIGRTSYIKKIDEILKMNENDWNRVAPQLGEQDKKLSQQFADKGLSHYAIKYNPFMGVISDYFLNEKRPTSAKTAQI